MKVYVVAEYGYEHFTIISVHAGEATAIAVAEGYVAQLRENSQAAAAQAAQYTEEEGGPFEVEIVNLQEAPPSEREIRCWHDRNEHGEGEPTVAVIPYEVLP